MTKRTKTKRMKTAGVAVAVIKIVTEPIF